MKETSKENCWWHLWMIVVAPTILGRELIHKSSSTGSWICFFVWNEVQTGDAVCKMRWLDQLWIWGRCCVGHSWPFWGLWSQWKLSAFTCNIMDSLSSCPWQVCQREVILKAYRWLYISFHQALSAFHLTAGGHWDKSGKVPCALLSGGWSIFDLETGDKPVFCQVKLTRTFLFSVLLLTAVSVCRMVIG